MPRRYRKTRVIRPKKKWATNMLLRNFSISSSSPTPYVVLVSNSSQTTTPTPVIIKTGNFKVNADITVNTGNTGGLQLLAAVLYVPEGISIPDNSSLGTYVAAHPEYILAWRQFDTGYATSGANSSQQVTFSSRLKRNLNSGDRVVFAILNNISGSPITSIAVYLSVQYWTCAN